MDTRGKKGKEAEIAEGGLKPNAGLMTASSEPRSRDGLPELSDLREDGQAFILWC